VPVGELRRFDPSLRTFTNINKLEELDRINATLAEKSGYDHTRESQESPDPATQ